MQTATAIIAQIARQPADSIQQISATEVERETHAIDVATRKQTLVQGFGRLASNGVDRLNEQMEAGTLTGALLMTTTGMATDKLALLSNDPQQINVTHSIEPGPNLYAKLEQLAERLNSQRVQGRGCLLAST